MKEEKANIDNFEQNLRKAAEELQVQPSENVWNNIKAEIPTKRRPLYMMRWAAAAAIFLAVLGLGWYFLNTTGRNTTNSNQSKIVSANTHRKSEVDKNNNKIADLTKNNSSLSTENVEDKDEKIGHGLTPGASSNRGNQSQLAVVTQSNSDVFSMNNKGDLTDRRSADRQNKVSKLSLTPFQGLTPLQGKITHKTTTHKFSPGFLKYPLDAIDKMGNRIAMSKEKISDSKSKVTFGAFFSSGISYRELKETPSPAGMQMSAASQSAPVFMLQGGQQTNSQIPQNPGLKSLHQSPAWGWNAGLQMGIPLPKNWVLKTGLSIQEIGYNMTAYQNKGLNRIEGNNMVAVLRTTEPPTEEMNTFRFTGTDYVPQKNEVVSLENQYLRAELPVLIGYNFDLPNRLSLTVLAGAGLTYLLNSNTVKYNDELTRYLTNRDEDKYLEPVNGSLLLEIAMDIPLSQHLGFSVGPTFQYQLSSSYKRNNPVDEFPYLIGLKTAIQLR